MSLAKVKDLLIHAQEHGYGIPAINVFDYNSIKFAAMAAEEAKMPLIIQYFPGFDVHAPLVDIRNIAVAFARRASVPIAVHRVDSLAIAVGNAHGNSSRSLQKFRNRRFRPGRGLSFRHGGRFGPSL